MSKDSCCKHYNAIDILKLVLSVFVMVIHSGIDKTVLSPLLRTAVPLFFIISSYFFFSKTATLTEKSEKRSALMRLVKRNLSLYLLWAIVQLPVFLYVNGYFHDLFEFGWLNVLKEIVLGNAFTGSWFILALVIGVVVVYWLSRKISAAWLVMLTLPLYILCCLTTNYGNAFGADSIVTAFANGYHVFTGWHFHTSVPIALFWVSLGRFIAEKNIEWKNKTLVWLCVIFGALLALERVFVVTFALSVVDDCYFMLVPFCFVAFLAVNQCKCGISTAFRVRELSTIIYVTHGSVERIVGYILKAMPLKIYGQDVIKVAMSLVLITTMVHIWIFLKEKHGFCFWREKDGRK